MEIRLAQKHEAAAMIEFNQAMALETEGKFLDPQILASGVESVFHNSTKGFYVVAEDGGRIVGGLMVTFEWSDWRDRWFWWIQSVYVIPEYRGRGIYSMMYAFVKQYAAERGDVCGFRLYVEHENIGAQRVYERLGMERSHYLMYEQILDL
ncbi:MAG: GNAT family N-acetyltransferase [Acidobacteria bacterium]|nr:GNAT family N-acetyltransferase [Acidobacteriota bacterium]